MGNKQGKLEERKDSKKNKNKNEKSNEQKSQNPSETAAPSPFPRNQKPELKIYQSFSGSGSGNRVQSPVELKFYRRSTSAGPTGGRYQSLPRNVGRNMNMGRSRSVTSSLNQSNGTLHRESLTDSVPYQRHSMIPPGASGLNDTRESIRSSSTYASYRGANGYRGKGSPHTGIFVRQSDFRLRSFGALVRNSPTNFYSRKLSCASDRGRVKE